MSYAAGRRLRSESLRPAAEMLVQAGRNGEVLPSIFRSRGSRARRSPVRPGSGLRPAAREPIEAAGGVGAGVG